jgi:hypothetical protein
MNERMAEALSWRVDWCFLFYYYIKLYRLLSKDALPNGWTCNGTRKMYFRDTGERHDFVQPLSQRPSSLRHNSKTFATQPPLKKIFLLWLIFKV